MTWLRDILITPVTDYRFLRDAMITAAIVGITVGVVSTLMVVRRSVMLGDALGHAVLPGVVIGWMIAGQFGVVVGALVVAIAVGAGIAYVEQGRRLSLDSALGVLFSACFALGLAIVSWYKPRGFSLDTLLLGSILGTSSTDVWVTVTSGAITIALVLVGFRAIKTWSFDPDVAVSLGVPVGILRYLLYALVGMAVVIALNTVGIVLVVALVAIPGATARLLTHRLGTMMAAAAGIGVVSAVVGLYLSYHLSVAAGPAISLTLTGAFLLAFLFGPHEGAVSQRIIRHRNRHHPLDVATLVDLLALGGQAREPVPATALESQRLPEAAPSASTADLGQTLRRLARRDLIIIDGDIVSLTPEGLDLATRATSQLDRFPLVTLGVGHGT